MPPYSSAMHVDRPRYVIDRPVYNLPDFDREFDKKSRQFPVGEKVKKLFRYGITMSPGHHTVTGNHTSPGIHPVGLTYLCRFQTWGHFLQITKTSLEVSDAVFLANLAYLKSTTANGFLIGLLHDKPKTHQWLMKRLRSAVFKHAPASSSGFPTSDRIVVMKQWSALQLWLHTKSIQAFHRSNKKTRASQRVPPVCFCQMLPVEAEEPVVPAPARPELAAQVQSKRQPAVWCHQRGQRRHHPGSPRSVNPLPSAVWYLSTAAGCISVTVQNTTQSSCLLVIYSTVLKKGFCSLQAWRSPSWQTSLPSTASIPLSSPSSRISSWAPLTRWSQVNHSDLSAAICWDDSDKLPELHNADQLHSARLGPVCSTRAKETRGDITALCVQVPLLSSALWWVWFVFSWPPNRTSAISTPLSTPQWWTRTGWTRFDWGYLELWPVSPQSYRYAFPSEAFRLEWKRNQFHLKPTLVHTDWLWLHAVWLRCHLSVRVLRPRLHDGCRAPDPHLRAQVHLWDQSAAVQWPPGCGLCESVLCSE